MFLVIAFCFKMIFFLTQPRKYRFRLKFKTAIYADYMMTEFNKP
jgi:hypothetical protein